jgi:hypothetical protein
MEKGEPELNKNVTLDLKIGLMSLFDQSKQLNLKLIYLKVASL